MKSNTITACWNRIKNNIHQSILTVYLKKKIKLTLLEQVPRWTGYKTESQHAKCLKPSPVCWHHLPPLQQLEFHNITKISNTDNHSWLTRLHATGVARARSVIHYITEKNAKCSKLPLQTQKVSNLYTRYKERFYGFDI